MTVDPTGKGIARPVVRIAEGGVAVGVALIIMSLAIVQGFQRDVRELVVGFGAHLTGGRGRPGPCPRDGPGGLGRCGYSGFAGGSGRRARSGFCPAAGDFGDRRRGRRGCGQGFGADADPEFLARALRAGRLPNWTPRAAAMELLVSGFRLESLGLDLGQRVRLLLADARGELRPGCSL